MKTLVLLCTPDGEEVAEPIESTTVPRAGDDVEILDDSGVSSWTVMSVRWRLSEEAWTAIVYVGG